MKIRETSYRKLRYQEAHKIECIKNMSIQNIVTLQRWLSPPPWYQPWKSLPIMHIIRIDVNIQQTIEQVKTSDNLRSRFQNHFRQSQYLRLFREPLLLSAI